MFKLVSSNFRLCKFWITLMMVISSEYDIVKHTLYSLTLTLSMETLDAKLS